jgi:hypothetical protein
MNLSFFKTPSWDIQSVKPPWDTRPSIYQHILAHIKPGEPGLGEDGEQLPDEELVRGDSQIGWAAGALDGVFGHHGGGAETAEAAQKILADLRALNDRSTDDRAQAIYDHLTEHSALEYIDQLLSAVVEDDRLDAERLHSIARWLAVGAADREPIKCAIALLGVFQGDDDDRDLLLTLGRHEEFTLYATVALQNAANDSELSLWALACLVKGWGRIQIIERLAETKDEQIKAWMLREGYRNDIMYEYTALICARTGDLLGNLRRPDPDEKLLKGAGSLLSTLIQGRGGPSEGMESYPEGSEAAELYLKHLRDREPDLEDFVNVSAIEQFLNEDEAHDPALGWPDRRETLLELISSIRARPGWETKVREGLGSTDRQTFWTATQAASVLGMDIWETYFQRIKQGEDYWYFAMQTDEPERIDRVVQLAEKMLPLDEIASGPAEVLGLGPEYQHHSALDFVLQDLRRFPGKGWPLIRAGLRSPVVRNRNMAVQALATWGQPQWPKDAMPLLERAIKEEPEEDTLEMLQKLLAGESLEFQS